MYKRFKGSTRNLLYAAGLVIMMIFMLSFQLMLELSLLERMINLIIVLAFLYCTMRFVYCYTRGIRIRYTELRIARFTKTMTIPIKNIKQVQMQDDNLHIIMLDQSSIWLNLKQMNEIDRKVITSLIRYYAPNVRD